MTWFNYLTFINIKNNNNNVLIFVKPIKKKIFTLTKAPIAHKTNSKEQFKFSYYSFTISFKSIFDEIKLNEIHKNSMLSNFLFINATKKNITCFETNLLFIKKYNFFSSFKDSIYFNLI